MRAAWVAGGLVLAAAGCNELLDIDGIEFGGAGAGGGAGQAQGQGAGAQVSSSTGHSGGGSTGGAGSGGLPSGPEDCANGMDDDGNGLIDCADDSCVCAPPAPMNWSGPVVLSLAADGVSCPADWPAELVQGWNSITAADVTCSGCSCGNPQGVNCQATISYSQNSNCSNLTGSHTINVSQACETVPNAGLLYQSVLPGAASLIAGSCPASGGGVASTPPIVFGEAVRVCGGAAEGTGCTGTDSCVALPPPPYEGSVCIYRQSGGSCPNNSPYSVEHTFASNYSDTRDCSACGCSTAGISCNATTLIYTPSTNPNCSANPISASNGGGCQAVTQPGSVKLQINPSGVCTPTGGSPVGSVSGSDAVTVCCLP